MGNSLQATALVNEASIRLVDGKAVEWHDRVHSSPSRLASLTLEPIQPEPGSERRRVKKRRQPLAERYRRFAVKEGHQLVVSPHVRRAVLQRNT